MWPCRTPRMIHLTSWRSCWRNANFDANKSPNAPKCFRWSQVYVKSKNHTEHLIKKHKTYFKPKLQNLDDENFLSQYISDPKQIKTIHGGSICPRLPEKSQAGAGKWNLGFLWYNHQSVNLVPRACDPREGTWGSGIICCQKPGILAKIELHIPYQRPIRFLPETDYPRASRSFQRIAGMGNKIISGYNVYMWVTPGP
jgi:hypothetical protein